MELICQSIWMVQILSLLLFFTLCNLCRAVVVCHCKRNDAVFCKPESANSFLLNCRPGLNRTLHFRGKIPVNRSWKIFTRGNFKCGIAIKNNCSLINLSWMQFGRKDILTAYMRVVSRKKTRLGQKKGRKSDQLTKPKRRHCLFSR